MKKKYLLLIFLLLLPSVCASDLSSYKNLIINTKIDFGSEVIYKSDAYELEFIKINLSLFPREDYRQKVLSFNTDSFPSSDVNINGDYVIYSWGNDFSSDDLRGYVDSDVRTDAFSRYVDKKVDFPLIILDEEIRPYLREGEKTEITDEIREKANEIVAGETDLFSTVFKIAEWTKKEVPYDLNTLTENAVQSSSWVFRNKKGVCDEITGLFISLCRSVGIPARFVSGTVYTEELGDWSNHGWAEVYFPDYGWIPVDVTFGQYGWVDSTHVVLDKSLDTQVSSLRYSWKAYDVEFKPNPIKIKTTLISNGSELGKLLNLTIKLLENDVSGGSYVPIQIIVENSKPYYVSSIIYFSKSPDLIEGNSKEILLKPFERRSLFWITKVPENLDQRFDYFAIIEVKDSFGSIAEDKLKYYSDGKQFSLKEVEDKINFLVNEEEKFYKKSLNFRCNTNKEFYYWYDNAFVNCSLINEGNTKLKNIEFCFDDCETFELSILEEKEFIFNITNLSEERKITMSYDGEFKEDKIDLKVLEIPNLIIKEITFDREMSYNDVSKLDLVLNTNSVCKDLEINLGFKKEGMLEIDGEKKLSFDFTGKDAVLNNKIKVSCKDLNGNVYKDEQEFNVDVTGIPSFVKLWLWVLSLFQYDLPKYA